MDKTIQLNHFLVHAINHKTSIHIKEEITMYFPNLLGRQLIEGINMYANIEGAEYRSRLNKSLKYYF